MIAIPATNVGIVLGTRDSAPLEFWVGVEDGMMLQLDDLVVVKTLRPNTPEDARHNPKDEHFIRFYAVVDSVRKLHEGVQYDSDTKLALEGTIPVNVSYAAHVIVTRVDPEEFIPPHPGDSVFLAVGRDLEMALYRDRMKETLPAGVLRNGEPAMLNFAFLNGENGAHVNISGVSGVATKTSYALFLLYSLFNSDALGLERANSKAVIFNVKGQDLLFLDQPNSKFDEREGAISKARGIKSDRYTACGLPKTPFQDVQFLAPPAMDDSGSRTITHGITQRQTGITPYLWTLREFAQGTAAAVLLLGSGFQPEPGLSDRTDRRETRTAGNSTTARARPSCWWTTGAPRKPARSTPASNSRNSARRASRPSRNWSRTSNTN